ncbi:MAG TPA: BatA domain-containing protein, partial [Planctomycetaceae bacterium]|nr:BatA domain-containing protein [Planctomycetaceae bacterium]
MSFLQPWLLWALPLIALPIIIHLINQRRFQTIQWAAMMFLLAAHRMARGYSRLRQILIMAARMLAVAGLLFAVARPLASGWIGLAAGGKPDTTIILLDRSPSMQQRGAGSGESKLETGKKQLVSALSMLGSGRYVLIDSVTQSPQEIDAPRSLLNLPNAGSASAPADIPGLMQAAHDYVRDNRAGRTEVWLCSDLAENDWAADSGRWNSLREAFLAFPQSVRFHLLAYPRPTNDIAIRVTDAKRQLTTNGPELYVSLKLTRRGNTGEKVSLPVQFEIAGARSTVTVDLVGEETDLKDHRIPLDAKHERGWGRVSIPADANPGNDDFYFVFDNPPPRKTVVVAEDPQVERPLELAASISPDPTMKSTAEVLGVDQLSTVDWDQTALVFWQAPLPTNELAERLQAYLDRGGEIVFLPPRNPGEEQFLGMKWG